MRVALASGGKESLYAIARAGGADYALIVYYSFPRPSPHLANLGKSVETLLLAGLRVVVARPRRGRELEDTAKVLAGLGASTIIAGDVMVEEHLRYMEELASRAGARLLEPLWSVDTLELLYREVEYGIRFLITGGRRGLGRWLGSEVGREEVEDLASTLRGLGFDPVGEMGEYHSLVTCSPLHRAPVSYRVVDRREYDGYVVLWLV